MKVRPEGDACPNCGHASLEADVVDIGVGNLEGPWHCLDCGWMEPKEDYGLIEGDDDFSLNGEPKHG